MTSGQNLDQWAASVIKQIGQYFKEKGQLKINDTLFETFLKVLQQKNIYFFLEWRQGLKGRPSLCLDLHLNITKMEIRRKRKSISLSD